MDAFRRELPWMLLTAIAVVAEEVARRQVGNWAAIAVVAVAVAVIGVFIALLVRDALR
jgi:ABC-type methionine transport system permease subunit